MTDDKRISRRQSLKALSTTGAIIGGVGLGVGTAAAGVDLGQTWLVARGYNPCKGKAKFRACNNNDKKVTFYYKVQETGEDGYVKVTPSDYSKDFYVKAPKGKATVHLYYASKKTKKEDKKTHVDTESVGPTDLVNQYVPEESVTLKPIPSRDGYKNGHDGKNNNGKNNNGKNKENTNKEYKYDGKKGKYGKKWFRFKVKNHSSEKIFAAWEVDGTDASGGLCLLPEKSEKFSVKLPKSWAKKDKCLVLHYGTHTTEVKLGHVGKDT